MARRSEVGDPSWGWVGMFCCEQELAPGFRREHGEERGETVVGVDRRNRLAFVPPLRVLLVLPWFPARPLSPELQPIRASSALPPPLALWPDRPFDAGRDAGGMRGMHALSRRSAVTRESRPSVHADLCVGISPLGIWAGEGWLAGWQLLLGRWDSGAGQWTGAPESRASFPLPPSPPVPQVIVP